MNDEQKANGGECLLEIGGLISNKLQLVSAQGIGVMARGKRKSGKRTASGRLSRAGQGPSIIRGNERAMARFEKYGQHASEALGRAYAAGLLRDPLDDTRGKERYDVAVRLQSAWRKAYRQGFRSALNDNPRGATVITETDAQVAAYHKMRGQVAFLDANGYGSWFHQLVLAEHPDCGPWWLDNLLDGTATGVERMILEINLKALDALGTYRDSNGNKRGLTYDGGRDNAHTLYG
ncbi:hypothetical protein [Tsuneonella sp. HG222]